MSFLRLSALASLLSLACAAPRAPVATDGAAARPDRPLPALAEAVRVVDARSLEELAFDALLDELARADVVFLGETHLDDTTHRVEAAVLEGLLARRAGRVVLSLEMFERDVQPVLDDYLAGRIPEPDFLERARPWRNYRTDYRPLIECARRHGIPVVAANAPAALRRKLASGGRAALEALSPAERSLLPAEILPASAGYWERVDRATRGHMNFASLPDEQRLFSGQNLWDNSMGEACATALRAHPGASVLHVVGGFHVMEHDGTAAQFARRAPDARVAVVEISPAPGLSLARPALDRGRADYMVYADGLARSVSDGQLAVSVPSELRYSIDLPPGARDDARSPLLVWLPDGDERPADARAFWSAALGDEVALAVVEPPYPWPADDLGPGGRWSKGADFRADQARLESALARLVEYVTRRLPVDGDRVVIAGEGLGATSVLWSALYTGWLDARFLAVAPRGAGALRSEGLPDRAPATRALCLLVPAGAEAELDWIRADCAGVGIPTELASFDPARSVSAAAETALRALLGLASPPAAGASEVLCVLERDLPRARGWAEVHARRLARAGRPARVVTRAELPPGTDPARTRVLAVGEAWPLDSFAAGQGIPLAEGDFGGTTVLVIPAAADAATREAWRARERDQALRARSPFASLRVAFEDEAPRLPDVLAELIAANRRSVLVAPAVFCASPAEMRALAASIQVEGADWSALDLAWLPGLGGELCTADPED